MLSLSTALLLISQVSGAAPKRNKFLIHPAPGESVEQLRQRGYSKVEDYGAYWLAEADDSQVSALKSRHQGRVRNVNFMNRIELATAQFDTTQGDPSVPRHLREASAARNRLRLVQFPGPVLPEWLELIKAAGHVRVISYVPNNAYLVQVDAVAEDHLRQLIEPAGPLQWVGVYHPYYKIQENLIFPDPSRQADQVEVRVVIVDGPDAETAIQAIQKYSRGRLRPPVDQLDQKIIQLLVRRADVARMAQLADVLWIEPAARKELKDEVQNLILASRTNQLPWHSPFPAATEADRYLFFLTNTVAGGMREITDPRRYPIVDIADTGIDIGSIINPAHPDFYELGSPSNPSRIAYATFAPSGCPPFGIFNGNEDLCGHGTFVASIVGGYSDLTNETVACTTSSSQFLGAGCDLTTILDSTLSVVSRQDTNGYQFGLGVSPFGLIGSTRVFAQNMVFVGDCSAQVFAAAPDCPLTQADFCALSLQNLVSQSYQNDARIVNNSWGDILAIDASNGGVYTADSQTYDQAVRDALLSGGNSGIPPQFPLNQEMIVVFAGGNDDGVAGNVGGFGDIVVTAPATAKNVITVGSTENVRLPVVESCEHPRDRDNSFDVSEFSPFGPTMDGRFKPDLVAPGSSVWVANNLIQFERVITACETNDVGERINVECEVIVGVDPCAALYRCESGTSFSAPAVSGGIQLLWWYFQNRLIMLQPSPAMAKAYLCNSARYLPFVNPITQTVDTLPSIAQGMGMMDLERMFDGVPRALRDQSPPRAIDVTLLLTNPAPQQTYFSRSGQSYEIRGEVFDTAKPFRVTVAWTDPPGLLAANGALVNDLDLQLTIGGQTYFGNIFIGGDSVVDLNRGQDRVNNIESIHLPAGQTGTWSVVIKAISVAGDGVPHIGTVTDQDFALVVYNTTAPSDVPNLTTNDTCQTAPTILIYPSTITVSNFNGSTYHNCHPSPSAGRGGIDAFWSLSRPTSNTVITVNTFGSDFNTVLSVWKGQCGSLVEVTSNDDSGGRQSLVSFTADGASTYYILVEPFNEGPGGLLVMNVTALGAEIELDPGVVAFADQTVGSTSAVQQVVVRNTGAASLEIQDLINSNTNEFIVSTSCFNSSIAPGGTCTIDVAFTPQSSGNKEAEIVVVSNAGGGTNQIALTGSGVAPEMALSATSLDFGTNVVGFTSPPQSIRVTNTGDGALVISSMTLGGLNSNDFAIVSNECVGNSILPGQTCQISLNFTTTTALSRSAVLTIVGNATNSPQTVALSGVGREFQCPAILVTPSTLPDATRALPYLQAITAINGVAPYRFVLTGGALPPGISLVENLLVGTAQLPGTNSFQITVYDANNCAAVQNYTLIVVCPTLTIAPGNLTNPQLGLPYDVTFTVSGTVAPVVFEIVDGGLPVGMDLDPAGNLSGAPAESGTFSFTVSATDSTGCTATRVYSFQISCPALSVSPNLLPAPQVGVPYNQTLAGVGGVSPYLFFRTAGAIPDGLALTTDGVLSGTVTSIGQYSFTVRAVDDAGCAGERVYTVKTVCPPLAISGTLPLGEVDVPYSTSMTATGGTAPYTFTAIAGSIPSGLVLDSDGTLSGVPTSGSSVFTVQATDANGCTGTRQYLITIAVPPPSILVGPSSLPAAVVETGFSQTLSAAGGVAPYSFSVASGSLPTGLNLAATGQISGTPTTAGEYPVIIAARDGTGQTGSQTYMMQVACPSFSLSPTSLPGGIQGTPYQQQLGVNHGGPVTYIVTSGVLPAGLVLGEDGLLAGTPTAAGSFGFTVRATLANGCATERTWALVVAPVGGSNGVADLQVLASASAAVATQGQVIAFTAVVTNAGPSSATGVTLVQTFSLPVNVSSVPAGVQVLGNTLIYTRSQLAAGGREAVVVQVAPQQIGTLTSSVTLTANQTDPSPGNNQAAAAVVVSGASAQVVTANATGTLMLTDTDGDIVTLQLRGGGTLSAVRETTGRILEIQLQNTGPASALRLKVKRAVSGDGTLTVGAVTGNGALRQLSARQLHLNGAGLTLAGYVARVDIGDILNGAAVRLGGTAAVRTTLRLHVLADGCQIVSGSALGSLQAARLGQGQVTAPSFGRVKVTGDRKQGIVAANEATLVIASGTP